MRGLDAVNVAVAQIGVLVGNDDRERDLVGSGAGLGIGAVGGVPLAAEVNLGLLNGVSGGLAVLDVAHDGLDALQLALEGDGLGVAVDDLNALGAQAGEHLVGGHAQADAHVEHGVGGVLIHVGGNAVAVDVGVAGALHGVVVGAVGAGVGSGVGGGDAAVGGQAEVGGVGAGGVVAVGAGVVGGAVGVEDDQAALLKRIGNVVNRGVRHGVTHAGAAGGAVEVLPYGLVVGGVAGKGRIRVAGAGFPVGLDQTDLGGAGAAAAGLGEILNHGFSLGFDAGDLFCAGLILGVVQFSLHAGVVAAGDADGGFPNQEVAVLLKGAGNVGLGALDRVDDLRDHVDVVSFLQPGYAAHGLCSVCLRKLDLGEDVGIQSCVFQCGEYVDPLGGGGLRCRKSREQAQNEDHDQQNCKQLSRVFEHTLFSFK